MGLLARLRERFFPSPPPPIQPAVVVVEPVVEQVVVEPEEQAIAVQQIQFAAARLSSSDPSPSGLGRVRKMEATATGASVGQLTGRAHNGA